MTDENGTTTTDTTPAPDHIERDEPEAPTNGVEAAAAPAQCGRCDGFLTKSHPAAPGHCTRCGHELVIEGALSRFADMAAAVQQGIERLASTPQGDALGAQVAGAAGGGLEALDERQRIELAEVTNIFAIARNGEDTVILATADRTKLPQQSVLNLCAWLSVLADLTDGDLIAARRKVEST
jgi:hypothetical protein